MFFIVICLEYDFTLFAFLRLGLFDTRTAALLLTMIRYYISHFCMNIFLSFFLIHAHIFPSKCTRIEIHLLTAHGLQVIFLQARYLMCSFVRLFMQMKNSYFLKDNLSQHALTNIFLGDVVTWDYFFIRFQKLEIMENSWFSEHESYLDVQVASLKPFLIVQAVFYVTWLFFHALSEHVFNINLF